MMEKSMFMVERLCKVWIVGNTLVLHAPNRSPLGFVLLVVPFPTGLGPWERTLGGKLLGQVNAEPVSDWSFVSDAKRCGVETDRNSHIRLL